jgi:hypothetical protein
MPYVTFNPVQPGGNIGKKPHMGFIFFNAVNIHNKKHYNTSTGNKKLVFMTTPNIYFNNNSIQKTISNMRKRGTNNEKNKIVSNQVARLTGGRLNRALIMIGEVIGKRMIQLDEYKAKLQQIQNNGIERRLTRGQRRNINRQKGIVVSHEKVLKFYTNLRNALIRRRLTMPEPNRYRIVNSRNTNLQKTHELLGKFKFNVETQQAIKTYMQRLGNIATASQAQNSAGQSQAGKERGTARKTIINRINNLYGAPRQPSSSSRRRRSRRQPSNASRM